MDLKIKDVAEILNVAESTVRRWLAENKIPAYKINRQYRFSRSEIEDWVLQQKLEYGEKKPSDPEARNMQYSLYRALNRGEVLTLPGTTKEQLIQVAMDHMSARFDLDSAVLSDLFLDREKRMTTALGHGIAVPHTRDFLLDTHYDVILTVYPETPLDYDALDGQPVHTLFFLFASEDTHHLHLLAKLAHLCALPENRTFLTTHPPKEALLSHIKQWESTLTQ